jgi:hypothetical protein
MKTLLRSLAFLSALVFSATNTNAQQLMIGVRAGTNLANQSNNLYSPPSLTSTIRLGFLAGGQFDYCFDPMWTITAQVLYDQKGTLINVNESLSVPAGIKPESLNGTWNSVYNYLEIPILLKASFGAGNLRPYVFAGPSFGLFLSGSNKEDYSNPDLLQNHTSTSVPDSSVKSPDVCAVFGTGMSLKMNSGQTLFIDASYSLGLVNVASTSNGNTATVKSRDIRLAAGILFPLN